MEFVKLKTRYYDDVAIMRAGEAAEVLFVRGLAYAGDQETDGFIPAEALPRIAPARGKARVNALIREGLWEPVLGGWLIVGYRKHQITLDQLEAKREAGRERVRAHREREAKRKAAAERNTRNTTGNAVTNGERCSTEVREKREEEAAAAASPGGGGRGGAELPVTIDILRSRLQRHTPLAGLRFDTLTTDQARHLEDLIALHGDQRLVDVAISTCRNPPPIAVTAFLGTWAHLPPPGQVLAVVKTTLCDEHSIELTPSGVCRACESDRKAAR